MVSFRKVTSFLFYIFRWKVLHVWAYSYFTLLLLSINGASSDSNATTDTTCGKVTTSDNVVYTLIEHQDVSLEEFEKLSQTFRGATVSIDEERKCKLQLCGIMALGKPLNGFGACIGTDEEILHCRRFDGYRILNDRRSMRMNPSSISWACHNQQPSCNLTCTEKTHFSNPIPWKEDECALLYRDYDCQDCYYNPIKLGKEEIFTSNISHHINSIIVRDKCRVTQKVPGYKHLCRFESEPEEYIYDDSKVHASIRSAFLKDYPEEFQCSCYFHTITPTTTIVPIPTTTSWTRNTLTTSSTTPSTSTTLPTMEETPAENVDVLKGVLGIVTIGFVLSLTTTIFLCISNRRRAVRLKSKTGREGDSDDASSADTDFTDCSVDNFVVDFPDLSSFRLNPALVSCREHVQLGKVSLGGGNFGDVYLGTLQVAVKTVKGNTTDEELCLRSLQHEVKILHHLGSHENVIRFLGASLGRNENELFLITEYCQNGSLKSYLKSTVKGHISRIICGRILHVGIRENGFDEKKSAQYMDHCSMEIAASASHHDLEDLDPPTLSRFLQWSEEIANGMEYITLKKVVHVDLSARNVLLTQNLTAKIGDFGLSKKIYVKEYVNSKKDSFPIHVAPECLTKSKYSTKSDIWAYGVTLWEIFSLGKDPYNEMNSFDEILGAIIQGRGLGRAEFAPDEIHSKLTECWKEVPEERPSFPELREYFASKRNEFNLRQFSLANSINANVVDINEFESHL